MILNYAFLKSKQRRFAIPVLTYHALHAPGTTYATSDHVALEYDLEVVRHCGFKVASLNAIASLLMSDKSLPLASGNWVGIGPMRSYR